LNYARSSSSDSKRKSAALSTSPFSVGAPPASSFLAAASIAPSSAALSPAAPSSEASSSAAPSHAAPSGSRLNENTTSPSPCLTQFLPLADEGKGNSRAPSPGPGGFPGALLAAREAAVILLRGRANIVGQRTFIVTGAKGGVGTSTVALNLSVQIAQTARARVLLMDYARPFGQLSLMLSFDPRFTLLDALERIERMDEALLASLATKHKAGIAVLAGAHHAALRAEQRQSVTIEGLVKLIEIAERAFDYVVVDAGFVNGAEWARVLREGRSIVLVSEPSELAMGMLGRYLDAAEGAGLDPSKFEIVINRWRQNDQDAWKDVEGEWKRPVISRLPNDYRQLTEAVKMGMPLMTTSNNPLAARYRDLAVQLTSAGAAGPSRPRGHAQNQPAVMK